MEAAAVNAFAVPVFALVPLLHRFGALWAPVSILTFAYAYLFVLVWLLGTGTSMQMYYLVSAGLTLLFFGYERVVLSATLIVVALIAAAFRYPNRESLLVPTPSWPVQNCSFSQCLRQLQPS
jgi:adenylate cyclase